MYKIILFFVVILISLNSNAWALSSAEKSYADRLANGGASSIRSVSSSLVNIQNLDPELYDVAAEVLLRDYSKSNLSNAHADALAWVTKALLSSGDSRYLVVLNEVRGNTSNPKIKKYAVSTASKLERKSTKSSPDYVKGMVNLDDYKIQVTSSTNKQNVNSSTESSISISEVKVGMSSGEVYALFGTPTSETGHITGKAFIPFNFGGRGNVRTIALYKGQGSIIFENTSAYTAGKRVVEVIIDPYEPGFR